MRRAILFLVIAGFLSTSFAGIKAWGIDVYTFKKERADQEMKGNQGYLSGKPENLSDEKRNLKRTLIGVDVEIGAPIFGKTDPKSETEKTEKKAEKAAVKKPQKKVTVVEEDDFEEEEWVK